MSMSLLHLFITATKGFIILGKRYQAWIANKGKLVSWWGIYSPVDLKALVFFFIVHQLVSVMLFISVQF